MFQIKWIWKNMQGHKVQYIFGLLVAVMANSMVFLNPYFSQQIIDTFISGENAQANLSNNQKLLITLLLSMVGFTILRMGLNFLSSQLCERASQGLMYNVRTFTFNNMLEQDASFFSYYRTGDIMTRLSGDLDMVRHSVAWIVKTILECVVTFSVCLIFFSTINGWLALSLIILTPAIFLISFFLRRRIGPMYQKLRDYLSKLNTAAEENISGNRVVKAFAREEYEIDRFTQKNTEYKQSNQNTALTNLKYFPALEITAQGLSVVLLIVGGMFVINDMLTLGEYAAFNAMLWALSNPMRMVGNIINDLQRFSASANKIIEVYYSKSTICDRNNAISLENRPKGDIKFENVTFNFGKKAALEDISFHIKAGQTVAVMGETGSGKTTLINMLPRIYDPSRGAILLDGVDIRNIKLKDLRKSISIATQDVLLFSDTVEGNICYGNLELSDEDLKKYADAADADGFISKMTEGYDTIIGERGVGLSGGQKQRIALARALATKPSVLILDDTTSAVDMETEKRIQESLHSLDFPCTKIIIAQRISSTKDADWIMVLKDGKIAEVGTHEELIQGNGYYREVYELQK